jgi:hypothetical protein
MRPGATAAASSPASLARALLAAALLALALGCVPPCPDTYPLCVETTDAGCRAWSASCCSGIAVCVKGTTFADDAGTCGFVPVPQEKSPKCQ